MYKFGLRLIVNSDAKTFEPQKPPPFTGRFDTTFAATGLDEEIVVHDLIAVGVPWKALEPASCTRCTQPVGGEIYRFPDPKSRGVSCRCSKKTAWNLQPAPGMTGMSTFEGYF